MKKKLLFLIMVFVLGFSVSVCAEDIYDLSVEMSIGQNTALVNGEETVIDENENIVPFAENGRTLVPVRFVANCLNLDVQWIQEIQSVILTDQNTEIILSVGKDSAFINDNIYELDCYPAIKEERIFVPIRFVGEALQCDVVWESETRKILVRREKEHEIDINDEEIQKLFQEVLNQNEFASYYGGYCNIDTWDSPENMFSGTVRELFSLLKFEDFEEKQYTKDEAEQIIMEFLSQGDVSNSLSTYGIDTLKSQIERGANYGSDSDQEILVAVYDGKILNDICVDLFGESLPKHENLAYNVGYIWFHLFNRVNLFYPPSKISLYNVYYNEASNQYLFTKYPEGYFDYENYEKLESDTRLIKATSHNGKISLYIQHYTEFDEYTGEKSTYKGLYKNTYKKTDNGYYWVSSYGDDVTEEK